MTYLFVLILISITVIAGYQFRLLTISGGIAAFCTGFFVYLGLGVNGLFVLGLFFASSSLWSKVKNAKKQRAEALLVKGSQRDWQQVLANGGLAALSSALYFFTIDPVWLLGFCMTIAAANSDTWASEIGSMSKGRPLFIKTLKRTDRGTSGAVSLLGTLASILGSFLIAFASLLLFQLNWNEFILVGAVGFIGNIIDTLLGAFVQAGYQCSRCSVITEKQIHCEQKTTLIKGYSFLNNDVINFLSGLLSLIIGILILK